MFSLIPNNEYTGHIQCNLCEISLLEIQVEKIKEKIRELLHYKRPAMLENKQNVNTNKQARMHNVTAASRTHLH